MHPPSPTEVSGSAPTVRLHPHQGSSTHRHSLDSMSLPAAVVFRHKGVIPGTVCGCGSDAAGAVLPVVFGTAAGVHPAEFIQLRLQVVYFALTVG